MNTGHHTTRRGFTLIELLVVVAIIALLAAILFPVFGRARENARRSSCSANVKQILLGLIQYTQDFDERFPPTYFYNSATVNANWSQFVQPYVKSSDIFRCPSDLNTGVSSTYANPAPNGLIAPFHTSYAANFQIGGNAFSPATDTLNYGEPLITGIVQPSATVYVTDGTTVVGPSFAGSPTTWATKANGSILFSKPGNAAIFAADSVNPDWGGPNPRHLGMSNVGFVDGHVKAMRAEKWYRSTTPWLDPKVGGS